MKSTYKLGKQSKGNNSCFMINSILGLCKSLQKLANAKVKEVKIPKIKNQKKTLLTDDQVREARTMHEVQGISQDKIALHFGLSLRYTKTLLDYTTRSKVLI